MDKGIDQDTKHPWILKQGRDVSKLHARYRPIGHGADVVS